MLNGKGWQQSKLTERSISSPEQNTEYVLYAEF
jgi:predicted rRNA methylase YqxC with S4 and FtsJ domains